MKVLSLLYIYAGGSLTFLILQVANGQPWKEFGEFEVTTCCANILTGLLALAFFVFSKSNVSMDRLLLVLSYVVGIVGALYFYYSTP